MGVGVGNRHTCRASSRNSCALSRLSTDRNALASHSTNIVHAIAECYTLFMRIKKYFIKKFKT